MSQPNKKTNQPSPGSYSPKKPEIANMITEQKKSASIKELQAYVLINGGPPKGSNKIKNIRRLWHDDKSENFYLEGCLTAVMKAIGENPKYDYPFFLTLCGGFFTQVYSDTKDATAGSTAVFNPGLVKHVFNMCGYDSIYIERDTIITHYDLVMDVIKNAIDQGIPVITKGIGNAQCGDNFYDPLPEWANIGGYGENGILFVNVYPENISTDEYGYIEIKEGLKKSDGLFIIGKKVSSPEYADILKQALNSIPIFISMPDIDERSFGQKAYYDWADMLIDENVDAKTAEARHFGAAVTCATIGHYFRTHYNKIIEELPEYALAVKIKDTYDHVYNVKGPEQKEYFATVEELGDPKFRKAMAEWARTVGDRHNELFALFH